MPVHFILALIFSCNILFADTKDWTPALENGRFRPLSSLQTPLELQNSPPLNPSTPLMEQLQRVEGVRIIPSRLSGGIWISVNALGTGASNFTPYPDAVYGDLVAAYKRKDAQAILTICLYEYDVGMA